ncbi:penicillin-binding protein [Virgibacillus phasianinus]|uniref:serine-type D-Ala-D-Ala carboxypeptidase n=1 Tax=Virgibacillus phasianinus TaxID=2017483 RepID=A0A220U5S3_9BACI|nr:penicillin-binding protein 2 [Virgibacillus phasianinus]ASK63181.1 penicillin-binding protein [Virgibacillus phasianinus]
MVKKKKKRAQLPFRLNILFFVVFLLFSALIMKLGVVQIVQGENYQEEINRTIKDTTKIPVPRGRILDRNHNVVVGNKPLYSITYTPEKGTTAEERLEVAEKLAPFIDMQPEDDELTERNKKEYWYLKHEDEATKRLSDKEVEKLDNSEAYQTTLDRITKEEISNFTKEQKEIINIKKELDQAYSLTPHVVKNEDVTPEEYAKVAEHLDMLPGINATTDWERTHPYDETLRSIFGSITTREQGIPKEKKDYYITRGYSRNDRVGISGLEQEYESVLRGRKEQIQYTTNKNGVIVDSNVVVEGERGKDVVLTIDMELQKKVDSIIKDEMKKAYAEDPYGNRDMDDAYAIVIDPQTGELLAVSGQHYDREEKEFSNNAYNTLYSAFRAGSTVKGATVLSGYESGVIEPGQTFFDAPIKIKGTPEKSSYQNESLGLVNDYTALQKSSNVYMFYIAMRMLGDFDYERNAPLQIESVDDAFLDFRNYFSQFGLGVPTGVDFPFESLGYEGDNIAGKLLDFAIGQYDTYTPMQLAQYVSTIANDGYRVRPRFLKAVHKPTPDEDQLGAVSKSKNTDVLNRITMDQDLLERVQEGFRRVYQEPGGTAYSYFADKEYTSAGKTGTAESTVFYRDEEGNIVDSREASNLALVGYAPYENPEVAFAIVVPNTGGEYHINDYIGERILDTYFDLKEKREGEGKEEVTNKEDN